MANEKKKTLKPADTPEGREKQLTNLAYNAAEKQLLDGTASSAVIVHFLKAASTRESLEKEIMEKQKVLIEAKADSLFKDKETAELVQNAMDAMVKYSPST